MERDVPGDRKWASLQKSVMVSLDKLSTGVATPADVKQMSMLIGQQSQMAGQLFAAAVTNIHANASRQVTTAAPVNLSKGDSTINKITVNNADGSPVDVTKTFREQLAAQSLDIIGSIRQLFMQQERESHIDQAFDTVRERRRTQSHGQFSKPPRDISGNVTLIKRIKQVEGTDAAAGQQRRLEASKPSVADKVHSLTQKRDEAALNRVQTQTTVASTSQPTQVKQALADNASLRTRAQTEWDRFNQRQQSEDQHEDKRSSGWMRKLKLLMGSKKDKSKTDGGGGSGMWSLLGKTLLLALLNPQLLKTIGDTVAQYLNFDSITKFLGEQWDNVKDGGGKVVDYIIAKVKGFFSGPTAEEKTAAVPSSANKSIIMSNVARDSAIDPSVTKERATRMAPLIQKQIDGAEVNLKKAQAAYDKDPSQDNKIKLSHSTQRLLILKGQLASYQARAAGKAQPKADTAAISAAISALPEDAKPATAVASSAKAAPSSTMTAPVVPAGPTPQQIKDAAIPSSTAIDFDDVPQFAPGQAFTDMNNDEVASQSSGGSSGGSYTPITIQSFGFQSGDDQLNLLNMELIA